MARLTGFKYREVARRLRKLGFAFDRSGPGSHEVYGKPGSIVRISVPIHGNRPLKIGLLKHLLKMADLKETGLEVI